MTHDTIDLAAIAHLARLEINAAQRPALEHDLLQILDMIEQLGKQPTDRVEPLAHPLEATQPLRPDLVTEHNQRDNLLANAPQISDGFFTVPAVIEQS